MPEDDRQRFSALFDEHYRGVLAYAARRTDPDTAQEIAAETFLVAWRRLQDIPGHPLPWLLVVARNTLANRHRSEYRRTATESEAAWLSRVRRDDVPLAEGVADRLAVLAGLAALAERDRETLLLLAWDGLTPPEAAQVAGCSTATFHVRLHRARSRLTAVLAAGDAEHGEKEQGGTRRGGTEDAARPDRPDRQHGTAPRVPTARGAAVAGPRGRAAPPVVQAPAALIPPRSTTMPSAAAVDAPEPTVPATEEIS